MNFERVPLRDFVVAGAGEQRFRLKFLPTLTVQTAPHTKTSRRVGHVFLGDEQYTYLISDLWWGGDEWDDRVKDYTEPAVETLVLRSTAAAFDAIARSDCGGLIECEHLVLAWGSGLETLVDQRRRPLTFEIGPALLATAAFEGKPLDFLVELELRGSERWWLERRTPGSFALTRRDASPFFASAAAGRLKDDA